MGVQNGWKMVSGGLTNGCMEDGWTSKWIDKWMDGEMIDG